MEPDRVHEVKDIVDELSELHEEARHLIGAPDARLAFCNRIERLIQRVKELDRTPRPSSDQFGIMMKSGGGRNG